MTRSLVIYVDVDDTLVRSFGSKRIPMPHAIEKVRELHAEGATLYCWSSGGGEYARKAAAELDLTDCFVAYLPKPHVLIDDVRIDGWRELLQLHPNRAAATSTLEMRGLLGWVT